MTRMKFVLFQGQGEILTHRFVSLITVLSVASCSQLSENLKLPESLSNIDTKAVTTVAKTAIVGCAGGLLLAEVVTGGALTAACLIYAVAGGILVFDKARQEEMTAATNVREELTSTVSPLNKVKGFRVGEIQTKELLLQTPDGQQSKKISAFASLTVDLPISTKARPEYAVAIGKIRMLAEKIANERGEVRIVTAMSPEAARILKINLNQESASAVNGGSIIFSRVVDKNVPNGIERLTVIAGDLQAKKKE